MTRRLPFLGVAVLAALVAVVAAVVDSTYWLQIGTQAGIFAIAAIGLTLLFGGSGQISVGHAGFLAIGAWVGAALLVASPGAFPVAALAAIAAAGLAGVVIGWAALRLAGWYLSLTTAAFGLVVAEVMRIRLPQGIFGVPQIALFGLEVRTSRSLFVAVWVLVLLAYAFVRALGGSRFGRALGAIRDDPVAAASCGVDVARTKVTVFCISAMLTGLSGVLYAVYQGSVVNTAFGFFVSVDLLLMVVVGGLGSPMGAVLGALFVTALPEAGRAWEEYRLTAFGLLLILAVVALPRGLAGIARQTLAAARRRPA